MKTELIVIETRADYELARAMVASLMEAATREAGARLRTQAAIVAAYEAEISPLRAVDAIEAIKFRMDQMG